MNGDIIFKAESINKVFPGVHALRDVDLELRKGEVHALLGENGAGKSTLIKVIGGMYIPDGGSLYLNGEKMHFVKPRDAIDYGISVIYQELQVSLNLSLAENIFFGRLPHNKIGVVDRKKLNDDARMWLRKVGLFINPNTKAKYLSTAQQQLLEIAKALSVKAQIIIMDEPTSALSPNEIDVLFSIIKELKAQGIAILYVSHKLEELFSICDRVTVMRDAEKIKTLDITSTNQGKLVSLMVGRKIESDFGRLDVSSPEDVLEIRNLNTHKLRDISLSIKRGEILGFCGLMGAGKSELARAVFGVDDIISGEVFFDGQPLHITTENCSKKGIGYIPEDRKLSGLFLNLSVKENMTISTLRQVSKNAIIDQKKEKTSIQKQIKALSIKTPSINQKICNLSGGNQQKCIISRWIFHSKLKLLIIDEPTRGIDVGAKQEIYGILDNLSKSGVAVMIMSSEMPELMKMSDRVVVLKDGCITAILKKEEINPETMMKFAVA